MPAQPYVTVTLRRDMVKRLNKINPSKRTSTIVTEAILEYIHNKTYKSTNRTPELQYQNISGFCTPYYTNI